MTWKIALFLAVLLLLPPGAKRVEARNLSIDGHEYAIDLPPELELGTRDAKFPVWPLWRGRDIAGYLYFSKDFVEIPGFSGSPVELLIALDDQGDFIDVRVLRQNEPVFVDGLGIEPLLGFLKQYRGKSVRSNIKVAVNHEQTAKDGSTNTYIDGISKASASVRIINETILAASVKVAREKLAGQMVAPAARPKPGLYRKLSWRRLLERGLIGRRRLVDGDIQAAFAGSAFANADPQAARDPDALYIDLYVAQANVPLIGRNLLDEQSWVRLQDKLRDMDDADALLVMARGPVGFTGENFVPGAVPDRLQLSQGGFPISLRHQVLDLTLAPGVPAFDSVELYRVDRRSGFDPSRPWQLSLRVSRSHGYFLSETASRDFAVAYQPDISLFAMPDSQPEPAWMAAWSTQRVPLAVTGLAIAALVWALARRSGMTGRAAFWRTGRPLFLLFSLVYLGWIAQGQPSIVTFLGLVKLLRVDGGLAFLLFDPVSLLLWTSLLLFLPLWGRGIFCGWLCPFGALQELAAMAGQRLGLRPIVLKDRWQRPLSRLRFAILFLLVAVTLALPDRAETAAEVEPFKTAITLGFHRSWPFVLYALLAVACSPFLFKAYCRFLCPLGALLSIPSLLLSYRWLPRRPQCGRPCQLCRVRCAYGAIDRSGTVLFADCVQCMDCVVIHDDPAQCVPLRIAARGGSLAVKETPHAP